MNSLSTLSDKVLERELLAPSPYPAHSDAAGPLVCRDGPAVNAELERRLEIAQELLSRRQKQQTHDGVELISPEAVKDWLRLYCAGLECETFVALYFDGRHRLIHADASTSVHPRELMREAIRHNAVSVIFAHHHPNGPAKPSDIDKMLTRNIREILALVEVRLLDYLIVAGADVTSFA